MNLHPSEEQLALYASDDLASSEMVEIRRHLTICSMCKQSVGAFVSLQGALRVSFGEPTDAELALMRSGLHTHLAGSRKKAWLVWVSAAAAVAVLALVLNQRHAATPFSLTPVAVQSPPLLTREFPPIKFVPRAAAPRLVKTRNKLPAAGLRAANWITGPHGSAQLRLTTADPDVVILLPLSPTDDKHEN